MNYDQYFSENISGWHLAMRFDELQFGDSSIVEPDFELSYDESGKAVFRFLPKAQETGLFLNIHTAFDEIDFRVVVEGVKQDMLVKDRHTNFETGEVELVLFPKTSPAIIFSKCGAVEYRFAVINGPKSHFAGNHFDLSYGEFLITYSEFDEIRAKRPAFAKSGVILHTGFLSIKHISGEVLSFEDAFSAATLVQRFFVFLCGDQPGIGHAVGLGPKSEVVAFGCGFNRFDRLPGEGNWYGISQARSVPAIFELFSAAFADGRRDTLFRTLEFYRASTVTRPISLEMAIVASSAALEVIVPYILEKYGKFDGNLLGERVPFHSKLRASFGVMRVEGDVFGGAKLLEGKRKSLSGVDAFEMSTKFRNRIVHQGKKFAVTGLELYEMWNLQMWMIEVMILFLVGYHGTMHDRRPTNTWVGGSDKVPFAWETRQ